MAYIKKVLRGYICDEREKNWTKEYAKREIEHHKSNKILDHPDESVTTKKLATGCVTKEKLADELVAGIDDTRESVIGLAEQIQNEKKERKETDDLKADKTEIPQKMSQLENDMNYVDEEKTEAVIKGMLSVYDTTITGLQTNKADNDLTNVSDEAFLGKLNAVLPDGDEVSY